MDDARTNREDDAAPPAASEEPAHQLIVAREVYPERLAIVPLPSRPIFPKVVAPIALDTPALVALARDAHESKSNVIGLSLLRELGDGDDGASESTSVAEDATRRDDVYGVGVVGQILKAGTSPVTGQMTIVVGGLDRFRIRRVLAREPYLVAEVEYLYERTFPATDELKAFSLAVINTIKDLVQLSPLFKEELSLLVSQGKLDEPGQLADLAAFLTSAAGPELQDVLETLDLRPRLEKVLNLLKKELDISKLQAKIRTQLEERITKQQREFFLREQLKAIKQELGLEKDDKEADIQQFLDRIASKTPSDEARTRIEEEISKLRLLEPSSPEFNLTRNYLDWLSALPWGVSSADATELGSVRRILDESHYGLDDVKSRILEFVAAGILRGTFAGSIICLVGPPGVGKTSIGRAVAKSLGRQFYRFSLGGMQDEAEIKGHRRTYIGAMPGKFIQALRVCKTQNPVIMLDEIDKIGMSYRGDPAAALLEALDPEQNRDFLDHYLDVRFDLSNVLFLCTANQLDTVPPPLLDRMEIIPLSGYILEEKLEIAERYILPRELSELRLKKSSIVITKAALREIIDGYAREAGLRNLEKQIKKIIRKSAVRLLEKKEARIRVDAKDISDLLGKRTFSTDEVDRAAKPGVVLGLAWTAMGGDTLYIEATKVRADHPGFKQTGQLGKVMVESSEIAYTHVRSLCSERSDCARFFEEHFIHLHVPAGAVPKDGPSAGITMAAALYTLARNKPIRPGYAMTGELNLRGHVMPVGGIREKVIAAKRAGVRHVVLPKSNAGDFERLPTHIKKGLRAHFVENFEDVVRVCL